jgi:heme/copper-type cytochrome/quinol oxidase subunit 4
VDRLKHVRNFAIIVALALIVWLVPGGGTAGATVSNVLGLAFAGALLFLFYRLYMEHRETIFGLPERQRGILYASLAIAAVALVGTSHMWSTGGGTILWILLIAGSAFGLYTVWQSYRAY